MRPPPPPPTLACWLLESVILVPYREAMLGDLIEEHSLRASTSSPLAASLWFWGQVCRSLPSMVWFTLRSGDYPSRVIITLGVYLMMGLLKVAADLAIARAIAPAPTTRVLVAPIVFLAVAGIGGCILARLRPNATVLLALLVLISVAVLIALKPCSVPVPWWYPFGFLTLGPLAVLMTPAALGLHKEKYQEAR